EVAVDHPRPRRANPHLAHGVGQGYRQGPQFVDDYLRALVTDVELALDHHRIITRHHRLVLLIGLGPHDTFGRAFAIFEREGRVALARLVVLELHRLDNAGQLHFAA